MLSLQITILISQMGEEILELVLMLLSLELESILAVLISVDTWTLNSCTPHSLLNQSSLKSQMCSTVL